MATFTGIRAYLALILLSIVWGSSFILIKKALIAFQPEDLACLRLSFSAISFLPILIIQNKKIPWNKWLFFLLVGLTGSGIPAFMYFIAQTHISSSVSGLLNSLTPLWTMIMGILLFRQPLKYLQLIGLLLGFFGALLLMVQKEPSSDNQNLWYGLFVVAGTLCYGISGNLVKHYFQDTRSIIISCVSFTLVGIPALSFLIFSDFRDSLTGSSEMWYSLGAVALLSIVGTVLATILFYKLIQDTSAVFGSTVAYIMPLVAVLWGYIDGESIGLIVALSMLFILFGVYLIRKA